MLYPEPVIISPLPRITPEQAGIDSGIVAGWVDALTRQPFHPHVFMLLKDGRVFAEGYYRPYTPLRLQTLYSLSKSFTSVAMGMAAEEGLLDLDERVGDLFPEKLPAAPGPEVMALTLRDCLRMATGQPREPDFRAPDLVRAFLAVPFTEQPGTVFRYNTAATYLCSAALAARGVDLEAFLQERLFTPLGIAGVRWMRSSQNICTGGFGLSAIPELLAKFGQLLLQRGEWQGRQLIPGAYLDLATSRQIDTVNNDPANAGRSGDWALGYGYQFWQSQDRSFRGDGMYGQYCVVAPEKGLVFVLTSFTDIMQIQLDLYFQQIAACFGPESRPLPPNPTARDELVRRLSALSAWPDDLPDSGGEPDSRFFGGAWRLDNSLQVTFFSSLGGHTLLLSRNQDELVLKAGKSTIAVGRRRHRLETVPGAGLAHWQTDLLGAYAVAAPDALLIHLVWLETLVDLELTLRLQGNKLLLTARDTHGSRPIALLESIGHR